MANGQHLLVPIKVQALVIDNLVIDKSGTLKNKDKKYVANDGKWSPLTQDYWRLVNALGVPGPKPFYGAGYKYQPTPTSTVESTDQLVLPAGSPALPKMKDRGVYLHWVLPSGLRHAYDPGSLDFPALPDQWLIVRFCRRGAEPQTKAWFVDSGLVVNSNEAANLLMADGNKYTARRVGKVVPLDQFSADKFKGERTIITALGNWQTGSPTFTAFIAENRNILSWHDDLNDLRDQTSESKVPKDAAISYLVLGWYRDVKNEPLAALPVQLIEKSSPESPGWLIQPPGWLIDSASPLPADLLERRCLFHGMVAHINYWSADTYQGPMLGYPGSPSVEGVLGDSPPSFEVGIGNNAEDALVSLVSSERSGGKDRPNLWKALEAVIYRQPESLIGSWNAAPRDHAVHQEWFSTVEAGKIWSIRTLPGQEGAFPADPAKAAEQTAIKPTPEQLAALKHLNKLQSAADFKGRELAALQQDLYARWWKLCEKSRRDADTYPTAEENACKTLAGRVSNIRSQGDQLLEQLKPLPKSLEGMLPEGLELHFDAAPRFWTPADPVIVVKNCGLPTKHQFPHPLPCRLPEQTVTAAEVVVATVSKKFSAAAGVSQIAALAQTHFAPHSAILKHLLEEASLVEQAINDLARRTLPAAERFFDDDSWRAWTEHLVEVLTWDDQLESLPRDQIRLSNAVAQEVPPHRLAELWVKQPWSPLFIDWQITWHPTPDSGQDFRQV